MSGVWALVGAALGYAALWAVVELGKKAFGKKKLRFEKPEPFEWVRKGLDADPTGGEGSGCSERRKPMETPESPILIVRDGVEYFKTIAGQMRSVSSPLHRPISPAEGAGSSIFVALPTISIESKLIVRLFQRKRPL